MNGTDLWMDGWTDGSLRPLGQRPLLQICPPWRGQGNMDSMTRQGLVGCKSDRSIQLVTGYQA